MEDAYPPNSEKNRKHGKSNETLDAGELLRIITVVKSKERGFLGAYARDGTGTGIAGKIYDALNDVIELNNQIARECEKI